MLRQEQIQFIRAQTLNMNLSDSRPNTRLFVFFGGINVTEHCYVEGSAPGTPIYTSAIGAATFKFNLLGGTFNVGEHDIVVSEVSDLSLLDAPGSTFGQARSRFNARGVLEIWQTTNITITTVERVIQQATQDPIAQQFFTYGISGGAFLSSIDLFFQTKDDTAPVTVEIRTLTNGYPTQNANVSPDMKCVLPAQAVQVQMDASLPSKFRFNPPIYLKEDSDYCFVVRSNSNSYNMYTSKMGERSIEDSRTIFEQPYVGSLFRSENSITWTAEQFEDVKFTLHRAVFDPSSDSEIVLKAQIPYQTTRLESFQTESGSNIATYAHVNDHGLRVGDTFDIQIESGFILNGIPSAEFLGEHTILQTPNSYQLEFDVTTPATQTGPITSGGKLQALGVSRAGSNYSLGDTLTISGGGGTGAAGYMVLSGGKIQSVVITSPGTGYTAEPTVSINTQTGAGGVIYAQVLPGCTILLNKPLSSFITSISNESYGSSGIQASVRTTTESYQSGETIDIKPNSLYELRTPSLIANYKNEQTFLQGNRSFELKLKFNTDADNVSPTVNSNDLMYLQAYYNKINDQPGEIIESPNESGFVQQLTVTAAGSGYSAVPQVYITPPDLASGIQATATVQLTAGAITGVTISNPGSGYLEVPSVVLVPAAGDNTGAGGAIGAAIQTFNTELSPINGRAAARYLTKHNVLEMPSNGLRLFAQISSVPTTQVEWYVRTSMQIGLREHDRLGWRLMQCDVERSRSRFIGEVFEYEFRIDDLPEFDTYDLKCVLRQKQSVQIPYVRSYRVIAIA